MRRSQKQIHASRRNGAKSQGPKSAAGKAASSLNALQHGLCSNKTLLLDHEDPKALDALRTGYFQRFQPADPVESGLVAQMVSAQWRLRRHAAAETSLIQLSMDDLAPEPDSPIDPGALCAYTLNRLSNITNFLPLNARYLAQIQRDFYRALKTLLDLRKLPKEPKPGLTLIPSSDCQPRDASAQPSRPAPDASTPRPALAHAAPARPITAFRPPARSEQRSN